MVRSGHYGNQPPASVTIPTHIATDPLLAESAAPVFSEYENFVVRKRALSRREIITLIRAIRDTPCITGYTAREWRESGPVFVAEKRSGEVMGACLHDDFAGDFSEIAVLFVFERHRRNGAGRALFDASCTHLFQRRRNALIVFREDAISRMVQQAGFVVFPTLSDLWGQYEVFTRLLNVQYQRHWLANPYRRFEITRKRKVFGAQASFRYGLNLYGTG